MEHDSPFVSCTNNTTEPMMMMKSSSFLVLSFRVEMLLNGGLRKGGTPIIWIKNALSKIFHTRTAVNRVDLNLK